MFENLIITASVNRNAAGSTLQLSMRCNLFVLADHLIMLPSKNPIFSMTVDVPVVLKRAARRPVPNRFEIIEIKSASWKQIRISCHGSKNPMIHNQEWVTHLLLKPETEDEKRVLEEALMPNREV